MQTPFGAPSDAIVAGRLGAARLLFLPRHGRGHRLLPSELPFRANIWALKKLGAEARDRGERGRQPARGDRARASRRSRSVHRPHLRAHRRPSSATASSRTSASAIRCVRMLAAALAGERAPRRRDGARRRHLRLHGGAAVLDARRVGALPQLGRRRDRHDEPAGGEARARGGAVLRDARARHRLRLLEAGRARGGDRGRARRPERQRRAGEARRARRRSRAPTGRRAAAAGARSSTRSSPTARGFRRPVKRDLAPIIGRYIPEEP